jgi:DNA processing protein
LPSDTAAAWALLSETLSRNRVRQLVGEHGDALAALRRRSRFWRSRIADLSRQCRDLDIALCSTQETGFPEPLRLIPDPPLVMFQRGRPACLHSPAVAIVGARRASRLGLETARTLACTLANSGVQVVSGLALGIDSAAHEGALMAGTEAAEGGQTIAVLGSGLGFVQPITNIPVAEAIVRQGGLLLSEYPISTRARPHHFPERNRLISGLVDVVVVIEAGERSGSLITARLALEQGREVLAVPGAISLPNSRGVNWLLKQGAGLVDSAQDVFDALDARGHSAKVAGAMTGVSSPEADLTASARTLLAAIREVTTTLDELCVSSGESVARVSAELAELELKGFVARTGGGYIRRPFNNSSRDRP